MVIFYSFLYVYQRVCDDFPITDSGCLFLSCSPDELQSRSREASEDEKDAWEECHLMHGHQKFHAA